MSATKPDNTLGPRYRLDARPQSAERPEIEQRPSFELLLGDVCAEFVNVDPDDLDSKIENAQRLICESLQVNHSSVWQVLEEGADLLVMTHAYRDSKLRPLPVRPFLREYFPWSQSRILKKQIVCIPNTAILSPEAAKDKESWLEYGIRSTLAFPLSMGSGSVIGLLAFDSTEERDWPEPLQRRLQILAFVIARALERKNNEQKVRMAENWLHSSEERLQLAQQAGHIGTFEWDIRTGVNSWTPELEAMYGLPPGGFGGTQTAFENLLHPDDRAGVIELVDGVLKTGQPTRGEWRVIWADGSVHWIAGRWLVFKSELGAPLRVIGVNTDITEYRQAEQNLRESEQRLRLAVQAGNMYAYEWDVATDKVVRSEEVRNIIGSSEPSCVNRMQLLETVHPDDRAQFIAAVDGLTPGNPTNHITYRVIRSDGTVIWLEKHGRAFFDARGRMVRMIGMVADITERKRTEERLQEYKKAVEGAEDIIVVVDREYRVLLANRKYLRMRNLTTEQVVGRSVPDVLGREVFETIIKPRLDECFRGNVVRYEMRFSYPTVGERDLLLSYFPIEAVDGTIDRAACILHDITERKQAEEALREVNRTLEAQAKVLQSREELLKIFVKNVPAGVAMLDCSMRYLQVSDRWCADYAVDASEVVGRSHYEIFPDIPHRWKEVHRRALQGETLRADEDRWDRAGGTTWAKWEIRPWWKAEGLQGGVLIFAEDVTHRKQTEEALSKVNQKLIKAHEDERTRIARELHDDINQRIALLAISLNNVKDHPATGTELRRTLEDTCKQVEELSIDVQALSHRLHSARLETLGLQVAAAGFCREFSKQLGVKIDFQSGGIPKELSSEISLCLFRVLQEAVQNAAKHSGSELVEVSIRDTSSEIELTVRDSGIGFEPEKGFAKGGLGLTSMRERLKLVNGQLFVESRLQCGTTVCARVPYSPQPMSIEAID